MPAAVSENTLCRFLGTGSANRRCSERRATVGRTKAARKQRREAPLRQGGTEAGGRAMAGDASRKGRQHCQETPRNGFGTARRKERFLRNRSNRLTGPDAGANSPDEGCWSHEGRKTGTGRTAECDAAATRGIMPRGAGPDATSITMQQHPRCGQHSRCSVKASQRPSGMSTGIRQPQSPGKPRRREWGWQQCRPHLPCLGFFRN